MVYSCTNTCYPELGIIDIYVVAILHMSSLKNGICALFLVLWKIGHGFVGDFSAHRLAV